MNLMQTIKQAAMAAAGTIRRARLTTTDAQVLKGRTFGTRKQQWRQYKAAMGRSIRKRIAAGGKRRRLHTRKVAVVLLEKD